MSIIDELEEIEQAVRDGLGDHGKITDALAVINRNQIIIARIIIARFENIDQMLRDIAAHLPPPGNIPPPGTIDATQGIIALNGAASSTTGVNTMSDTIKDNAAPAKLSVTWSDAKGAPAEGVTDAWTGDGVGGAVVTDNGDGTATFTPGTPGTVTVTVIGTNADGTTVTVTDQILVTPSDATVGTITLTP